MSAEHAWSCQELADHADNWSLAGNVALLKHMEQFAGNMFREAERTNNNLESLLEDLDKTEIQLDLVKNQFWGLQNTQFIESRVYEDDETVAEEVAEIPGIKLDDTMKRDLLKNAVVDGLKVLDKYYEQVSIPESDSEGDEADCCNYVLREKDPYINRPLPYIIGTEEWHTKWHAGLAESSDEDGDDDENGVKENGSRVRVEDEFSDTDDERHLPVADRRFESQEFNSTMNDSSDTHVDYEEVNGNSVSAQTPITNATFAEQLAVKLGDVLTTPGMQCAQSDPEVNTRPIQRKQPSVATGFINDLLSEIPEDSFGAPSQGLFSGGGGLFDDDDNFEKPPPIIIPSNAATSKKKVPNLFDEDEEDDFFSGSSSIQTQSSVTPHPTSMQPAMPHSSQADIQKKKVRSLFDESDEEEEDDFAVPQNETYLYGKKDIGVLFPSNEPPSLVEGKKEERKKPIGGVNVLGGFFPKKRVSSSSSDDKTDDEDDKNDNGTVSKLLEPVSPVQNTEQSKVEVRVHDLPSLNSAATSKVKKRVLSLFDDTDDLFEDDLFPSSTTVTAIISSKAITTSNTISSSSGKQRKSLFDDQDVHVTSHDVDESHPPPLLPSSGTLGQEVKKKTKTRNLFDESSEEEDDMFTAIPTLGISGKEENVEKKSLFRDLDDDKIVTNEITGDMMGKEVKKIVDVKREEIIADIEKISTVETKDNTLKQRFSLFDDKPPLLEDDDWDDPPISSLMQTKQKDINATREQLPAKSFESEPTTLFGDIIENSLPNTNKESSVRKEQVDVKAIDIKDIKSTTREIFKEENKRLLKPSFSLLDDRPPLLQEDDDWDDPPKVSQHSLIPAGRKEIFAKANVEEISEMPVKEEKSPEKKLPGKLKHNLNINVNALIPGAKILKSQKAVEIDEDGQETKTKGVTIPSKVDIPTPSASTPIAQSNSDVSIPKEDQNQDLSEDLNILTSVTKTRAKIPIKRHPSTRRGRKVALANSHNAEITKNIEETDKVTDIKQVDIQLSKGSEVPRDVVTQLKEEISSVPPVPSIPKDADLTSSKDSNLNFEVNPPLLSEENNEGNNDDFKSSTKNVTGELSTPTNAIIPTSSSSSTPRKQLIVEDFDGDTLKPSPLEELLNVEDGKKEIKQEKAEYNKTMKKISLFDDLDEYQDNDDLFTTHPKKTDLFQSLSSDSLAKKKGVENVRVFDDILPTKPLVTKQLPPKSTESPNLRKTTHQVGAVSNNKVDDIVEPKKKISLFGDVNEDDDDDLFAETKIKKASKVSKYHTSLFGDNDDDDDLFGDIGLKKKVTQHSQHKQLATEQVQKQSEKKNISLFGDEDDQEDIFASTVKKKATMKKTKTSFASSGTLVKAPSMKQAVSSSKSSVKNDPLADLFADSD